LNKRKYIRSSLSAVVRLSYGGNAPIDVILVDLSLHGMLVRAQANPQTGQECHIQILLGDSENKMPVHAVGRVVRVQGEHFAVQFHAVGLGDGEELENSILVHADDPEACLKEFALSGFLFDPLTASSLAPYPVQPPVSH